MNVIMHTILHTEIIEGFETFNVANICQKTYGQKRAPYPDQEN